MERPEFITDEMLDYLDTLRESGVTNMFGATPYLEKRFKELRKKPNMASACLSYWMRTFGKRHKAA